MRTPLHTGVHKESTIEGLHCSATLLYYLTYFISMATNYCPSLILIGQHTYQTSMLSLSPIVSFVGKSVATWKTATKRVFLCQQTESLIVKGKQTLLATDGTQAVAMEFVETSGECGSSGFYANHQMLILGHRQYCTTQVGIVQHCELLGCKTTQALVFIWVCGHWCLICVWQGSVPWAVKQHCLFLLAWPVYSAWGRVLCMQNGYHNYLWDYPPTKQMLWDIFEKYMKS